MLKDSIQNNHQYSILFLDSANVLIQKQLKNDSLLTIAIQLLDSSIKYNPRNSMVYNQRAKLFEKMGEHHKAFNDYDIAIYLNPRFGEAYANRGSLKIRTESNVPANSGCDDIRMANALGYPYSGIEMCRELQ